MRIRTMLAAIGLAAAAATPLAAQVDARQYNQDRRIQQGVRTGEISRPEYRRLQRQQARIDRTEDRMRWRNGGRLNRYQRARLNARQNRASANIYRQKHDWQHRRY